MDLTGQIIAFEQGELTLPAVLELFANLIATGLCWQLQGSYGRMAHRLIDAGYIDAQGNIKGQEERGD